MKVKSRISGLKIDDALMFGQRAHNMGITVICNENEDYYLKPTPLYMMGKKCIEYQFFAEVGKKKENKKDIFEYCIFETIKWLIARFGELPAPRELVEQLENTHISSLHCEGGCIIDIAYVEEMNEKHWAIYFSEPDPGTPFRFPQSGSVFETNIAYSLKDGKISCGFRTIPIQPENADFEMEVFRPSILSTLADEFGLYNAVRPIMRIPEKNISTSKIKEYIENNARILPIIVIKNNNSDDLNKIDAELLSKTLLTFAHVYVVPADFDENRLHKDLNHEEDNECIIFYPNKLKNQISYKKYTKIEIMKHKKIKVFDIINQKERKSGYRGFEISLIDDIINDSLEFYKNENNSESKKDDMFYKSVHKREIEVAQKYGNLSIENRLELVTAKLQKKVESLDLTKIENTIRNDLKNVQNDIKEVLNKFTGVEQLLIHGNLTYSLLESAFLESPVEKIPIATFQPLANAVEVYLRQKIFIKLAQNDKTEFMLSSIKKTMYMSRYEVANLGGLIRYLKENSSSVLVNNILPIVEDDFKEAITKFNNEFRIPAAHTSDLVDMKAAKEKINDVYIVLDKISKYIK